MKRRFEIFLVILSMGVLLLPQQKLWAQNMKMDCCEQMEASSESCHMENESLQSEPINDHDCQQHCITDCGFCLHTSLSPVNIPVEVETLPTPQIAGELTFSYLDPYFSSKAQDIWQPPKIA